MRRVAFVTSKDHPELTADDRLAVAPLAELGVAAVPAVWDDPAVDWPAFSAVILRSPWDYHLRYATFLLWLEARQRDRSIVWNGLEIVRWNIDKWYLKDLVRRGAKVLETAMYERGAKADLAALLASRRWSKAVVKPAVSAGAHRTWIAGGSEDDRKRFERMLAQGRVLVQPLIDTMATSGEWSFVFLDGMFSHAVLKRAKKGDFRVQEKHGGTTEAAVPTPELIEQAQELLDAAKTDTLYARVDGVLRDGTLELMELELFEPSLYLSWSAGAPERFARAVADRLG